MAGAVTGPAPKISVKVMPGADGHGELGAGDAAASRPVGGCAATRRPAPARGWVERLDGPLFHR